MECATPLDTASVRPLAEERKVVTALFETDSDDIIRMRLIDGLERALR